MDPVGHLILKWRQSRGSVTCLVASKSKWRLQDVYEFWMRFSDAFINKMGASRTCIQSNRSEIERMVQVLIEPAGTPLLLALANTYYDKTALASSTILRVLKHYSTLTPSLYFQGKKNGTRAYKTASSFSDSSFIISSFFGE